MIYGLSFPQRGSVLWCNWNHSEFRDTFRWWGKIIWKSKVKILRICSKIHLKMWITHISSICISALFTTLGYLGSKKPNWKKLLMEKVILWSPDRGNSTETSYLIYFIFLATFFSPKILCWVLSSRSQWEFFHFYMKTQSKFGRSVPGVTI